ncbi:exonuclease GOR-like [Homalodisca vitripennis]|uniref:exonuclease GOR-like n=1 Tax=Homalodisca vitripennis TaxID=197043 RepID=UPI001EEAD052|nr:exonuclease GOR-like [Homalodisca vitripennis]
MFDLQTPCMESHRYERSSGGFRQNIPLQRTVQMSTLYSQMSRAREGHRDHSERLAKDYLKTVVYVLDCEMGFTVRGLELLKVTVITQGGSLKYESLVRPEAEIVDYNTRFSGVKDEDYRGNFKTLREVHSDLTEFIKEDTILIGHGLENDLRAFNMVHSSCEPPLT